MAFYAYCSLPCVCEDNRYHMPNTKIVFLILMKGEQGKLRAKTKSEAVSFEKETYLDKVT